MTILERIKNWREARAHRVDNTVPENLTFVNDEEALILEQAKQNKMWYVGNSVELLNYWTNFEIKGWAKNPLPNRNKRNYFWGLSSVEVNIKRIHSGLPKVIIDKLSDILDVPSIDMKKADKDRLQKILDFNNFEFKLKQKSRPLTLAEGWGAYKVNYNPKFKYPTIEFYEAENVRFQVEDGLITGVVFLTYFQDKNPQSNRVYVLFETRTTERVIKRDNKNMPILNKDGAAVMTNAATISYDFYEILGEGRSQQIKPAKYEDAGLNPLDYQKIWFYDVDEMLAVPSRYYYDALHGDRYGRSILDGKSDLIDDLDECLSVSSRTARLSTPVEYIDTELLEKDMHGNPKLPSRWDREYVKKDGIIDSDGKQSSQGIVVTQAKVNFNDYNERAIALSTNIMEGIISPSSMGKELSRKDNAEAQREKEKVTLTTREHIIEQEGPILRKLYAIALFMDDYINGKKLNLSKYDNIRLKYNEFGTPAFEEQLHSLGEALVLGGISPTEYVERIYRDNKTEEWKKKEVAYITKRMQAKDFVYNSGADNSNHDQDIDGKLEK